jgi:hypothetical protein
MGILEDIQKMKQAGMQDNQIILKLQEQGNSYRAISEAISQSKIKQAVESSEQESLPPMPSEMQQQEMSQETQQYPQDLSNQQETAPQEYFSGYEPQPQDNQQQYQEQNDTMMEISEQVVSEKLSDIRKKLENMSSFKTEIETKAEAIEDRLNRIEKIIDSLQTSVLRKVGDYVTNVEDIKKELIESQKTIAKALGSKHHKEHKKH